VVTTLLTNSVPGRTADAAAAAGTASAPAPVAQPVSLAIPYDTGGSEAGAKGTASISIDPGGTGSNEVHVLLTDRGGNPVDVTEVRVAFGLPAKNLGPLRPTLQKLDTGHWATQVQLPLAGDWQVSVTVRSSDIDETTQTARASIG
jgi:copper transport protein